MEYSKLSGYEPYGLDHGQKEKLLTERLAGLTLHHMSRCRLYKKMMDGIGVTAERVREADSYRELPFLPVRLFRELELVSVPEEAVFKTMTSSGTTGQRVSKIYLDRTTASNQQKTMVKIVSDFIGNGRMPMLILDCPSVVKDRLMFSARGAGILGFSMFGSDRTYALTDGMELDADAVRGFLKRHEGQRVLLFGFTFMVWQHFYKELARLEREDGERFDFSRATLIHGGGWKKLAGEAVSPQEFKAALADVCGLSRVHDYYGMVEQTGCIYMECGYGHLHASIFSDVIIRDPKDFSICGTGREGVVQVLSALPESYPGHSLLTEDTGILLGEDDCPCGRKGKYFRITGRIRDAEIRGCSDTYAADFGNGRR